MSSVILWRIASEFFRFRGRGEYPFTTPETFPLYRHLLELAT